MPPDAAVRPPLPPPPYEGGCICGAARYRLTARPLAVNACHCTDCQRLSGAGAGVFLHMRRGAFEALGGAGDLANFRRTADSGREIDILRCASCGTRLWHAPLAVPELVLVSAHTLDEARWVVPTSHIWLRSAGANPAIADDALSFEESAPDRQMLWDRFAAIYGAG